jgi:hypothetical protein
VRQTEARPSEGATPHNINYFKFGDCFVTMKINATTYLMFIDDDFEMEDSGKKKRRNNNNDMMAMQSLDLRYDRQDRRHKAK